MNSCDATEASVPPGFFRRIRGVLRNEGTRGLAARGVARFYRRIYLLKRSLADPIAPGVARIPIVIEIFCETDLVNYAAYRDAQSAQMARQFLADGRTGFLAHHEGKIVGDAWATDKPVVVGQIMAVLLLKPGEIYFFDAFTLPEFRGQSIAPALSAFMLQYYANLGFKNAIRATRPSNAAALKAHAKSGFRIDSLRRTFRFGRWRYDVAPILTVSADQHHGAQSRRSGRFNGKDGFSTRPSSKPGATNRREAPNDNARVPP